MHETKKGARNISRDCLVDVLRFLFSFFFSLALLSDVCTSEWVSVCAINFPMFWRWFETIFFHEMFRIVVLNIYLIRHRWTLIESVIMAARRKPEHVFTSFLRCDAAAAAAAAAAHVVTRLLRSNKYRAYKHEQAIKRQWLRYGMSTAWVLTPIM